MKLNYHVYKGPTEYSGVFEYLTSGKYLIYRANKTISYKRYSAYFKTKREAALFIDSVLIKNGKSPINILKKVQNHDTKKILHSPELPIKKGGF